MTRKITLLILSATLLAATACYFPLINNSEDEENSISETIQAMIEQTQAAATYTPLPTLTPLPTYTPYPSQPTLTAAAPKPCNEAVFISETIEDNTEFSPNEEFTKSWRLKNTGTCTWNPDYELVFDSGDRMNGPKAQDLDTYVSPGEYVDIVVDLETPDEAGTYNGAWRLASDDGEKFARVYTQIIVVDFFAVTSVDIDINPASYSGACPDTITVGVDAEITASSDGKVTYRWEASNGVTSDWQSVKFSEAGTKTVSYDWDITASIDETLTIELYVDKPNHQAFSPREFVVDCTP